MFLWFLAPGSSLYLLPWTLACTLYLVVCALVNLTSFIIINHAPGKIMIEHVFPAGNNLAQQVMNCNHTYKLVIIVCEQIPRFVHVDHIHAFLNSIHNGNFGYVGRHHVLNL